jgi:uncharacterized damage-inducible protein DinB
METLWVDRTWEFSLPPAMHPFVLERIRGTPARVEEKVRSLPRGILTRRHGDRWSIQEHIGHLLDLDGLHVGRLDDYLAAARVLRAADMTNRKTWEANHNARPVEEILHAFREERARFVARLDAWPSAGWGMKAEHPRLKVPMRVIDMAFFVAEHDDHHLAWMTELARRMGAG